MRTSYLTTRRLDVIARDLADRERSVLSVLGIVRVARADQLARCCFHDVGPREYRRVLAGMTERQLLHRLDRQIGGVRAGSAGSVYAAGIAAQRVNRPGTRGRSPWTPSAAFLDHALATTEVFVKLIEAQRARLLEIAVFQAEPEAWRAFTGPAGTLLRLKPDAFAQLRVGGHTDNWFVELDLASESPRRLAAKCAVYAEAAYSGIEQRRLGVFPRTLFVVPGPAREVVCRRVFAAQARDAQALFDVCLADGLIERILRGAA